MSFQFKGLSTAERALIYRRQHVARLGWQHGDRAHAILEGRDPVTNADLSAWRNLGTPKAERGRA